MKASTNFCSEDFKALPEAFLSSALCDYVCLSHARGAPGCRMFSSPATMSRRCVRIWTKALHSYWSHLMTFIVQKPWQVPAVLLGGLEGSIRHAFPSGEEALFFFMSGSSKGRRLGCHLTMSGWNDVRLIHGFQHQPTDLLLAEDIGSCFCMGIPQLRCFTALCWP